MENHLSDQEENRKAMKWKDFKKRCRFIIHMMLMNDMPYKWTAFNLSFSCLLWDLRGLQRCPHHGTYAQSLWNGFCKECGEIPKLPPIEEMCTFCSEEKAVLQRANPNDDEKDIWSLCWECDQYITWSLELSWCQQAEAMGLEGKMIKPFDEWLFEKHQVYPKGKYNTVVLKRVNK